MNKKPLVVSTIILSVAILIILVIFFFQGIYTTTYDSESLQNQEVKNYLTGKIIEEKQTLVVYPESQEISVLKGTPKQGFAFSVINDNQDSNQFKYKLEADYKFDFSSCSRDFSLKKANSYILEDVKEFNLKKQGYLENPVEVLFSVPSDAPSCEIPYKLLIHYKTADTWYPYASTIIKVSYV